MKYTLILILLVILLLAVIAAFLGSGIISRFIGVEGPEFRWDPDRDQIIYEPPRVEGDLLGHRPLVPDALVGDLRHVPIGLEWANRAVRRLGHLNDFAPQAPALDRLGRRRGLARQVDSGTAATHSSPFLHPDCSQ